jgi:hypothetical protein
MMNSWISDAINYIDGTHRSMKKFYDDIVCNLGNKSVSLM